MATPSSIFMESADLLYLMVGHLDFTSCLAAASACKTLRRAITDITDVDVEKLIETGRPWEVAVAGRMLPRLARLHGYGFVVDVTEVRAAITAKAALKVVDVIAITAKAALNSCIPGVTASPPLKLMVAAVACAGSGSGVVRDIPLQQMRESSVTELDLSYKQLEGPAVILVAFLIPAMTVLTSLNLSSNNIGPEGAKALAPAIAASPVLAECNVLHNNLDIESAKMLAKIGTEKGIMLSGIKRGQKEADFYKRRLGPADAILIASDIRAMPLLASLNLSQNQLCGMDWHYGSAGTYVAEGINAIAAAICAMPGLTDCDLRYTDMGEASKTLIRDAVKGKAGFKLELCRSYR
jgi:hypothetical protein